MIVVLPMFLGIEGVMYSAPVADLMAALLALVFVTRELRRMRGMEEEMNCGAGDGGINSGLTDWRPDRLAA